MKNILLQEETCSALEADEALDEAVARAAEIDGALEALKQRFPYKAADYENYFNTLEVLGVLRTFCREHPVIDSFYGKGSIGRALFIDGSDIDHIRIKAKKPLSHEEKISLVNGLDAKMEAVGVTKLRRIRDDDYVRVFYDWKELKDIPNAGTREFELYPGLDVLTINSLDPAVWMNAVMQKGIFIGDPRPLWIQKMGDRIASSFDMVSTYYPNAEQGSQFVFAPRTAIPALGYAVTTEYINITNYSPFSHVNEVSERYRNQPFMMPFYAFSLDDVRPVHPDTFTDLELKSSQVDQYVLVYPTSSFRTVYDPRENVCYKLPLMRTITRGVRDLPDKALQRAEYATKKMSQFPYEGFSFLNEEVHYADDPRHNYIKRIMPDHQVYPWFYEIASQDSDVKFQMKCMENIIKTWMFYASHDLFLEYHTQNILVDRDANIVYRDLSDIMIHDGGVSDRAWCKSTGEALAISFDRTVCNQNLDHAFRYNKDLGDQERGELKALIRSETEKYGLEFPTDCSLSFSSEDPIRVPKKTPLVGWRSRENVGPQRHSCVNKPPASHPDA